MKNLDNLAKMHGIRKNQMIYETKKEMALERWLDKSTAHYDTPEIRKQATELFNLKYPPYKECPYKNSKLGYCPEC